MEVHHHAHHEGQKNWKSHFWEFLMLFLAVFAGFLAENQREHIVERQREEKYVLSLIQDLKADTANLQVHIAWRQHKRIMMDSLMMLLTTGRHKDLGNETYFYARYVFAGDPFYSTDGTLQQLKNAGNLRLIRKEKVVNSILSYDAQVKVLHEWDEVDIRVRTTFREIGGNVFNADVFYKVFDTTMHYVMPANNPQLVTNDPVAINKVSFQVQYLAIINRANVNRCKALTEKAETLIELLKKEYHLE